MYGYFVSYNGWHPFLMNYWYSDWYMYNPFVPVPTYFGYSFYNFLGYYAPSCYCLNTPVAYTPSVVAYDSAVVSNISNQSLESKLEDLEKDLSDL